MEELCIGMLNLLSRAYEYISRTLELFKKVVSKFPVNSIQPSESLWLQVIHGDGLTWYTRGDCVYVVWVVARQLGVLMGSPVDCQLHGSVSWDCSVMASKRA